MRRDLFLESKVSSDHSSHKGFTGSHALSTDQTQIPSGVTRLTHLSLFSGIGGIDVAAEKAGFRTIGFVERDPFCQAVLNKNFPGVPIHGDISTFKTEPFVGTYLVSGGFPCQDVSVAAHRATGIEGDRSGLFRQLVRVLREIRPRFGLLENVSGLIVGRGIGAVLGALAQAGFDATWGSVPASSVGAFHQRERVFILAYPSGERCAEYEPQIRNLFKDGRQHSETETEWHLSEFQASPSCADRIRAVPKGGLLRMVDGVPSRLDRYRALGNAVDPYQVYPLLKMLAGQLDGAA